MLHHGIQKVDIRFLFSSGSFKSFYDLIELFVKFTKTLAQLIVSTEFYGEIIVLNRLKEKGDFAIYGRGISV